VLRRRFLLAGLLDPDSALAAAGVIIRRSQVIIRRSQVLDQQAEALCDMARSLAFRQM
jgi:hypothetical protein